MVERASISLDEFKARLPLLDIVGRHVRLTRRGREHLGLCPFHREKTPSFTVSEAKGFYHCFGCGQHGNAIDFIMAVEGLDFAHALERLAELTGVPAPRGGGGEPRVDQTLYAINEAAVRWFAGRLESPSGEEAADYLTRRGLDRPTIERFGLGFAPNDRTALKRALMAEGYDEARLLEVGLLIKPEDGGPSYDRFRHRVMFPIHDRRGRVVGFGGRALGEARAKYLNTPETPIFHKGDLLYGLARARQAIRERGTVIVAEGYMDVIALAQAGFANAVAPLGTAITEAQLRLLWQQAEEPIICLDGDEAGLQAGRRLIERALPALQPGKSLRFALMPQGADPDDVRRTWGRESLARRLREARPLLEFLWESETRMRVVDTPERRAALRQRLLQMVQTVPDGHLRRLFRQSLEGMIYRQFGAARATRSGPPRNAPPPAGRGVGADRLAAGIAVPEAVVERELLWPIVEHPEVLGEIEEELAAVEFVDAELAALRDEILGWYAERGHLDPGGLKDHLCQTGHASLIERLAARGAAWCHRDRDPGSVLVGWRACVAQRTRFAERRGLAGAVSAAIAGRRDDEAKGHVRAVDRALNRTGQDRGHAWPESAED